MSRSVALLRGINVGGKNLLPMADLRRCFEDLGHSSVITFIQSGNVVFRPAGRVKATDLEVAIEGRFGLHVDVVLRTSAKLAGVVKHNPFGDADPAALHVGFMASAPPPAAVRALDVKRFAPEQHRIQGSTLYLCLPDGMGRAKLPPYLNRALPVPVTVRNWKTTIKLLELSRKD